MLHQHAPHLNEANALLFIRSEKSFRRALTTHGGIAIIALIFLCENNKYNKSVRVIFLNVMILYIIMKQ